MVTQGRLTNVTRNMNGEILLEFASKMDFSDAQRAIDSLKDKNLDIEAKIHREKRSKDANAYYWEMLTKLASKLHVTNSYMHNMLLRDYGQIDTVSGQAIYISLPESEESIERAEQDEKMHLKPTSNIFFKEVNGSMVLFRDYCLLKGSHLYDSKEMSILIDGLVSECKSQRIDTLPKDEIERLVREWQPKAN